MIHLSIGRIEEDRLSFKRQSRTGREWIRNEPRVRTRYYGWYVYSRGMYMMTLTKSEVDLYQRPNMIVRKRLFTNFSTEQLPFAIRTPKIDYDDFRKNVIRWLRYSVEEWSVHLDVDGNDGGVRTPKHYTFTFANVKDATVFKLSMEGIASGKIKPKIPRKRKHVV